ncbi:hypothetical protein [Sorangium sp. So ce1151]|uniref:hypothetical protein n=1 Tax=Sorangium sp. So ce1151 TaxID=3133332 RepID=UPI003F619768
MRTSWGDDGDATRLVLEDVAEPLHAAVVHLGFAPTPAGFVKRFPSDVPHLARAFQHFERSAEAMVAQAAGQAPVPWDDDLEWLCGRLGGAGLDWCLVGSAALAARGIDVTPGDIDVLVTEGDARRVGELLADVVVEPPVARDGWFFAWFGRAFRRTRIEWVGGINLRSWVPEELVAAAQGRCDEVSWRGRVLRLPPLDAQERRTVERGLVDRAAAIARFRRGGAGAAALGHPG